MSSSKKSKNSSHLPSEEIAAREEALRAQLAMFEQFKAGDRSTPQLQTIQVVVEGVNDLKARIIAAKTIEDFQTCYNIADKTLYDHIVLIEWIDPFAPMFMTDTRNWCNDAINWIKWTANPVDQPDFRTESLEEAREWALGALSSFEMSMM